ncbi:TlpA family protein disulfide reductase [halophilic archaeon]|nr:TlpA family protein disulfide reductase [halophilic archaeon]
MDRRRLLLTLGGLGLTGGSAWVVQNGLPSKSENELPVQIDTLEARGSTAGTIRVPVSETPTVIDLFATWCAPCKEQMDALQAIRSEYGDDVAFLSITNERVGGTLTKADIRDWWRQYGGRWTVGLDPGSDLMSVLGVNGLPYIAITDAGGKIQWEHDGVADAATLRHELDQVLTQ